jgi:1,4-alpha-glucan branching enzyme
MIKVGKPDSTGAVRVTFSLPEGEPAGPVSVVGDFNGWDPFANPLRARRNGTRSCVVKVPAGSTLRFRYLADGGVWFNDDTITVGESEDATLAV